MTGLMDSTRTASGRHFLWGRLSALGLSLALLAFLADQSFTWWMLHELDIAASQPIAITPFFSLVLAWNSGVSYGWFAQNNGLGQLILIILSLLAAAGLWVWLTRTLSPFKTRPTARSRKSIDKGFAIHAGLPTSPNLESDPFRFGNPPAIQPHTILL